MRRVSASRVLAPLAVVIVLAAVYGLTLVNHTATLGTGQQVLPSRSAAATSVVRACPSLGLAGPTTAAALVAAPPTAGQGLAELSRLNGTANAPSLRRVTNPGRLSTAKVRAAGAAHRAAPSASGGPHVPTVASRGGAVVQASGSMARGLEVEQITAGGIPLARCGSPGTDFWFVGPGEHSLASIQLFLVNAGSQPAAANVEISTDAGPLQGSPDTGIAVPPHSMVVQYLASLVRGSRVLALHVRTSTGQVVAAVRETTHAGSSGAWLPAAQPPATRVVLPGLPAAAGTRQLFVTVPGAQDAHLKLTAVTGKGSYQPTGSTGLDIPGGSAVSIPLPSLSGVPAALRLSSNVPVTASAMLAGGASGAPGVFTAASRLVLSAPGRAV